MRIRTWRDALILLAGVGLSSPAMCAEDPIDALIRLNQLSAEGADRHAYSDYSDPLGRFMDMLAAGAFADAKAIRPAACRRWLATRADTPFTGRFWVWGAQLDMDDLCRQP
jgi:hypothetical protein